MKTFLHLFGKFNEVNLRDPKFGSQHKTISLDAAYSGVFVFLPIQSFEISGYWCLRG